MDEIARILAEQHGVVARRQLLECGLGPSDVARLVRRRELTRVHPGVFVDHTGPLSWIERAWAAVLCCWPAALTHESALRAAEGPGRRSRDDTVIHVAVERHRHLVTPDGVRVHRSAHLADRTLWNLGPPRIRYEHVVLDVAESTSSDLEAIAVLADACGSRRSTAVRLLETLASRPRHVRRGWLRSVLDDVVAGTCSVLEHGYLTRVERAHGLPTGRRQASHRHGTRRAFRDVRYDGQVLIVELDGELFHASTHQRDRDLDRDLDAVAREAAVTIRLSWGQVFDRPCRTAQALGAVLQRRGWTGEITRCPECG